ncbi:MAG: AMP-binding protein, partial [Candidatus Rokuibacteriota bacterium]
MDVTEIIWRPDPEAAARTRMGRFMKQHGVATLADLQQRSVADPEWYWDAVSRDLGFHWFAPYRRVLDSSRGIAWPQWFPGGRLNLTYNALDRHLAAGRGGKLAVIAEAEDGGVRTLTYMELGAEVGRLANALKRLGIRPGDTVGIFLPMCAEAVIATLAVARIGAVYTPCFSGYGAQAVASRLDGCGARLLITADAFARRGQ